MVLEFLFYKPVVDYGLGRIGFGKMAVRMLVRWTVILTVCGGILGAFVLTAPGVMTGKLSDKTHEVEKRAAREAAFQEALAKKKLNEKSKQY